MLDSITKEAKALFSLSLNFAWYTTLNLDAKIKQLVKELFRFYSKWVGLCILGYYSLG